jgi:hypothetical protein
LCAPLETLHGYRGEAGAHDLAVHDRARALGRWRENRVGCGAGAGRDDPEIRAALESLLDERAGRSAAGDSREQFASPSDGARLSTGAYAEILECKYLRDMSIGEIARQMGRKPKATESLLTGRVTRFAWRSRCSPWRSREHSTMTHLIGKRRSSG